MDKEQALRETHRYAVASAPIVSGPNQWNRLNVRILCDGREVGSYQRNYPALFDTFVPFVQDGKTYALYSPHYTATRVMSLPDCADIGGEEPDSYGFCPTGFYVPYNPEKGLIGTWGLISGCLWGDDSSWKIQYLDLSSIAQGQLRREEKFGYLELPQSVPLKDAVNLSGYEPGYGSIRFTVSRTYFMTKGTFAEDYD